MEETIFDTAEKLRLLDRFLFLQMAGIETFCRSAKIYKIEQFPPVVFINWHEEFSKK